MSAAENRAVGFPWSQETVNRALSSAGGTVAATHAVCRARAALLNSHQPSSSSSSHDEAEDDGKKNTLKPSSSPRISGHLAGGTHHAFRDRGEGFCVFSDIAVASGVALRDYPNIVRRILIVDLDVHQVCKLY
jgi:acetoin utilization deacetylase AcuC-like enzyme